MTNKELNNKYRGWINEYITRAKCSFEMAKAYLDGRLESNLKNQNNEIMWEEIGSLTINRFIEWFKGKDIEIIEE